MTREQQDEAFATYAANLQASMDRHPAGKRIVRAVDDHDGAALDWALHGDVWLATSPSQVGTPIYDSIVLGQYEQPSAWARLRTATASWYSLLILTLIVLWYLS